MTFPKNNYNLIQTISSMSPPKIVVYEKMYSKIIVIVINVQLLDIYYLHVLLYTLYMHYVFINK